jgi:hypothetical protein
MSEKFCVDCKHYNEFEFWDGFIDVIFIKFDCRRPTGKSLVSGEETFLNKPCHDERESALGCGPAGKYWGPKP